ncbi:MAG: DUF1501 domain-containing protein [Phycisphaera sp.]|nr:DUF1501 domain-containing protein [Phycisphaera sp.]
MLTFYGKRNGYCDSVSRRSFMRIGALGLGGLTMIDLMRLEAQAGIKSSHKALINVHLGGGPSHQDTWDLKPDAPAEYRGEFNPISTNVPGMQICELFPKLATMADRFSVIRSIVGSDGQHASFMTQSGWSKKDLAAVGGEPSIGAVVTKLKGSTGDAPPFVSLMGNVEPGYLGPTCTPYQPDGRGRANLTLRREMSADRMQNRAKLLSELDTMKRDCDSSGYMQAMDTFTQRAVDVVCSGRLADALDNDKEDPKVRARYRASGDRNATREAEQFLTARRLIEAGVRCVSLSLGGYDTHQKNFSQLRQRLPILDAGISGLLTDLHERGMQDDVTLIVWGEFGRTPRINNNAGRDHWPRVMGAFVAGGGIRGGQTVGETDRNGGEAYERPVHVREVTATLYHNLGINARRTTIIDPAGRPQYLVDDREPIRELV